LKIKTFKDMNQLANFTKGFIRENPVFVLLLGMCPTLGVTTSAINGLGMGLATTFVLVMSNLVVSLVKNFIPDKVRIPSFIVIIASFVTIVELVMQAYLPALFEQLGLFIPLIVVNCIVLGRAEAFASKNTLYSSIIDGLGMGLGFAFALTLLGGVREILGSGAIFGMKFLQGDGMLVFVLAPGAFIALGYLIALINRLNKTA
jgi:electron transport complex protein RnfE